MSVRIIEGDALTRLREMPDRSVQMCCTSPPYFGLRDYGVEGQLGLEKTPQLYVDAMVGVFSEVKRVLRDDGTLWLNIGDSYWGSWGNAGNRPELDGKTSNQREKKADYLPRGGWDERRDRPASSYKVPGIKPKDLIGIPWALATALRAPRYTGEIKSELDRVWLAATIDAEGCISGFRHERKDDGRIRTGVNVTITNTSERLLDEATRIWPASRHDHMSGERLGTRPVWRWIATNVDRNAMLMRELYPYLIVKRVQALLAYNLFELSKVAKRDGQTSEGAASRARRDALVAAISELNQGRDVDIPSWCVEPPTPTEPGWYLRSDIIWHKPNPMPESVTDRPTKSHEYLFLLSKSERYYYDADAILEPLAPDTLSKNGIDPETGRGYPVRLRTATPSDYGIREFTGNMRAGVQRSLNPSGRNKRSVWTVNTSPYSEAHFATFPPKLIEPCILAGSAKQACEKCGAPWERDVERRSMNRNELPKDHPEWRPRRYDDGKAGDPQSPGAGQRFSEVTTLGFKPTCDCENSGTGKSLVLDPFGGAGTTGLVADRLGRDAILIELNPKYAEMARKRIHSDNPLFTDVA